MRVQVGSNVVVKTDKSAIIQDMEELRVSLSLNLDLSCWKDY